MLTTAHRATWPNGLTVIWRSLTWKEYQQVTNLQGDFQKYAEVYRRAVIDGPPIQQVTAGIVSWIGRYELDNNPFGGNLKAIQRQRQRSAGFASEYLNAGRALVSWAFGYKFEELDEWDATKFFNRLAQAEYVFGKPFDPVDPNAAPPTEEERKQLRKQRAMNDPRIQRIMRLRSEQGKQ